MPMLSDDRAQTIRATLLRLNSALERGDSMMDVISRANEIGLSVHFEPRAVEAIIPFFDRSRVILPEGCEQLAREEALLRAFEHLVQKIAQRRANVSVFA